MTRAARKDAVTAEVDVAATEAANDGFWPAPLFIGKTVYRVHCRLASGAGHNSMKTSLLSKCTGLAVLRRSNSVSGTPLIQFWIYLLGIFQFLRGDSADLELGTLSHGTR